MSHLKTALYELHLDLGAKIVDFAGWQMPIQYKNLKEEVKAVRENVGVFDVSHMGEFFVEGKEAINFIDYLVTNNIKSAAIGKAVYSPLCDENGHIIDDLIVYKLSESKAMICVNAANIEKDYAWFEKHASKFECELSNKSSEYSLLAIQGPKTFEVLKSLDLGCDLPDMDYYSIFENGMTLFARTGYTGEDGFEVFGDHEYIKNLWNQLIDAGVTPCGLGSRDVLRLEVCYPLYGHELNQDVTPLDSGLKWTVKFDKEDFIGKSALENYSPKYQLIKIILDKGIPREGYSIEIADEKIGTITSGTMSVALSKGIALGRVEKKLYDSDKEIIVDIRGRKYSANIVKKAFVSGGHK